MNRLFNSVRPTNSIDRFVDAAVWLLVLSGLLHVPLFWLNAREWEDPLSFRKAILFGISTGLTLWSCDQVFRRLRPLRFDGWQRTSLASLLVGEVFLISLQTWRGERSHFSQAGGVNEVIETAMLLLITMAVVLIMLLTARCLVPRAWKANDLSVSPARRLALQSGMVFLAISCTIGFAITIIGNNRQEKGLAPEVYGSRGVLKFPHGAALHAIQTLDLLAWVTKPLAKPWPLAVIRVAVFFHAIWLGYALNQTANGRSRWERIETTSSFLHEPETRVHSSS